MTLRFFAVLAGLVVALSASVLTRQDFGADLRRAKQRENSSGDCKLVLADYTRIAEQAVKNDRGSAAEALLRVGMCQEKTGDAQASLTYAKVVNDFKDQRTWVEDASRRLTLLSGTARSNAAMSGSAPPVSRFLTDAEGWLSPDGSTLAQTKSFDIKLIDIGSSKARVLVAHPSDEEGVCTDVLQPIAWSRDARQLAYLWCFHPGGDFNRRALLQEGMEDGWDGRELRTIGIEGGAHRVVLGRKQTEPWGFTGADRGMVTWSPDGETILISAKETTSADAFGLVSVKTGTVTDLEPGSLDRNHVVSFSPDSRSIAYTRRKGGGLQGFEICWIRLPDGKPERIVSDPESDNRLVDWTPNGAGLVFLSDRRGTYDIGLVHVRDGKPTDVPGWLVRDIGPVAATLVKPDGSIYYRTEPGGVFGRASQNLGDVYLV